MNCDVVVIGGGPAGAVAATRLARSGVQVLLVERTHFHLPRPGEFLSPLGKHELISEQMLDAMPEDAWAASPGILSCWHDEVPRCHDFIFNPWGEGWRLNRCRFDASLCNVAAASGALCLLDSTVLGISYDPPFWNLHIHSNNSMCHVKSRFIIVAAGRTGFCGVSSKRKRDDKQIALLGVSENPGALSDEPRLLVESLPDGWCYALATPDGKAVVAILTDSDLLTPKCRRDVQLQSMLKVSKLVGHRLGEVSIGKVRVCAADTSESSPLPLPGVLVIGDALNALDPLSGNGIAFAVRTARLGAQTLLRHMDGEPLRHYEELILDERRARVQERHEAYQIRRFPHSTFWQRRRKRAL